MLVRQKKLEQFTQSNVSSNQTHFYKLLQLKQHNFKQTGWQTKDASSENTVWVTKNWTSSTENFQSDQNCGTAHGKPQMQLSNNHMVEGQNGKTNPLRH